MSKFHPQNWIFMIPEEKNSTYILYAPLHGFAVRISNEAQQQISKILYRIEDDTYSENILFKFLVENNLLSFPQSWTLENIKNQKGNTKLILSLTNKCNLRCIYCYAETGTDFLTMPWEIAKASISHVIQNAVSEGDNKISVTFHGGGEAFVEYSLLQRCVEFTKIMAKKYNLKLRFSAVTNATLIDYEKAVWMKNNDFNNLTVSLDGIEGVNDIQRKDSNGKGSFSKVMNGIDSLNQAQLSFSIRSTITDYSVDKMAEFVTFASQSIFTEKGLIHFEPISLCGRAKTFGLTTNPKSFFENYIEAKDVGEKCGIVIKCSMDTFKKERKYFCGASYGTMFCVTPSGHVTSCSRVTKSTDAGADLYFYGQYDKNSNSFIIDQQKLKKIIAHGTLPNRCQDCFARWNCQGGCPIIRYPNANDLEDACEVTRKLLKHFLAQELESVHEV
jgi:uncharacterized protein